MKPLSCLLLALPLLLARASAVRGQEKLEESPLYPLQVGNTWNYRAGDNMFAIRVAGHEKVGSALCARVEIVVEGKTTSFEHVAAQKNGVYRHSFEGKEVIPPVCFLRLPPKEGESWKVDSKFNDEALRGTFKVSREKSVAVPAGTFENVVVSAGQDLDANGAKVNVTYYFAEGVGMVKQVIETAGQKMVIELMKFEPPES